MKRKNNTVRSAFFLIRSMLLFVLLYLAFFAVGGIAFWYGCLLTKLKLTTGCLPYDLPSILPVILLLGSLLLIFKMAGSLSAIRRINRPDLKKITREEHPELFLLIDETAAKMRVSPPRRVYLSATVSASVFLPGGFWNVFRPATKRMEIGMGLLNVLNRDELCAVLAHELGHFSQKATGLSAPVYMIGQSVQYLMNKIEIRKRGVVEEQYYIFAYIFRLLANILFSKLSKDYASLSEALEQEADGLAAQRVSGTKALVSALMKASFASQMFDTTLNSLHVMAQAKQGVSDFYAAQHRFMSCFLQMKNVSWSNSFIEQPIPGTRLSKLTRKRIEKLQPPADVSFIMLQAMVDKYVSEMHPPDAAIACELIQDFERESIWFTQSIYRHQLGIDSANLSVSGIGKYGRWITRCLKQEEDAEFKNEK